VNSAAHRQCLEVLPAPSLYELANEVEGQPGQLAQVEAELHLEVDSVHELDVGAEVDHHLY